MPKWPKPEVISPEAARLGMWLRTLRVDRGISQRALAKAIGVSENTLRWHEAGSVLLRFDKAAAAAKALKVRSITPPAKWVAPEVAPSVPTRLPAKTIRREV